MTPTPIRAVLFDMGGTLEDIYFDEDLRRAATPGLAAILAAHGIDAQPETSALYARVESGMEAYQEWRLKTELELPPEKVLSDYIFRDGIVPEERLAELAEEWAFYYDTQFFRRRLRPEVPEVLARLRAKGLRLGLISNAYSRGQVPFNLQKYGIAGCFDVVMVSSLEGRRKPNRQIFLDAARRLNLGPGACAYVGDTVSRDVIGAQRAGYGLAIQIKSFLTSKADRGTERERPDAVVENLLQVVDLVTGERREQ